MPNFGLCESLPDAPPTPNPAPPVTPVHAPVTPASAPAPAPARKPVPVDADGPARAIPKREIELQSLKRVLARSPNDDPACELAKRSSDLTSSAEIRRRCGGGPSDDGRDEGQGEGGGGDGGEVDTGDTGSEGSSEGDFSDLDGEQLADLDLPGRWNNCWF